MQRQEISIVFHWLWSSYPSLRANHDGLINQTFIVHESDTPVAVLQRLNTAIFIPQVNEDIEAITTAIHRAGLPTPRLLRTLQGALWHQDEQGSVWRCMTYEGNRTVHRLSRPLDAWQAGGLVARFHAAVHGVAWEFRSVRPAVHDTQAHMNRLEQAIARHRTHRLFDDVAPLAEEIRKQWETWHGTDDLPRRIIHGDLKVSNVRFVDDSAHCLIDLDTMGWGTFDMEMGDAMRSWCNPTSEDSMESRFDIAMFESAMSGYADACRKLHTDQTPTRAEWESVVAGVERVTLELASRFARDALEEAYFGFNPRYGGRGEHNLLRARGQFHLAQRVREQAAEAERILHNLQTRLT